MPLQTTAESPVPVRTVLRLAGEWVGRLGRIWVEGQIAELTRRGGTAFLTLRDPVAAVSVRVICARAVLDAADPPPAEGARVVVWAKPDLNTARGSFSLTGVEIRAVGIGELLARLDRLRRSLAAEGLFAAERKRPLPFLPATIGLICGRDSAAERDVLRNAAARWPAVRFRVEEVAVQGLYAVAEVTDALHRLDADRDVEVIVIARGGGSVEDLLPFSDETLIRAVAACQTPVVSAIGHEQDSPLLDLVADVRASTPSLAAKLVVPDHAAVTDELDALLARAGRALEGRATHARRHLELLAARPAFADPRSWITTRRAALDMSAASLRRLPELRLEREGVRLRGARDRLRLLGPAATLERGYAIVQDPAGAVVREAGALSAGDRIGVRLAAGRVGARVEEVEP